MDYQPNFLNVVHNINNTRLYRMENELFCYTATRSEIQPYATTSIRDMAKYLLEKVSDEQCEVNLMFGYAKNSLSKNKQKKLKALLKCSDLDMNTFIRWVSLL